MDSWRASGHGLDQASLGGTTSIFDPLFVGPLTVATGFKLQTASPAKDAGRVGGLSTGAAVSMGAYATGTECIGLETLCVAPPPPPPDLAPPVRTNGQPSGSLPAGTTETTMSLSTNENATCRYSVNLGLAYENMTATFTGGGGAAHTTTVSPLSDGGNYTFYVRCQDTAGNVNTDDFSIVFSVASPAPPPPPPPTLPVAPSNLRLSRSGQSGHG